MLGKFFPTSNEGAAIYGGFLQNEVTFCRVFPAEGSLEDMLIQVNIFLEANFYDTIQLGDLNNETFVYEKGPLMLAPHGYYNDRFVLFIKKEIYCKSQNDFIINELKKFRDEREWEQFHNPKDLSLAISIEANELLEQFLWKNSEQADLNKVKEELADIFSYALLLVDKYQLNIEEIVLEKIRKNAEKYPIDKAKGNAKKHDEL